MDDALVKRFNKRWMINELRKGRAIHNSPHFTLEGARELDIYDVHMECYFDFAFNPNITNQQIRDNIDKWGDFEALSWRPALTWDIVVANPKKGWNFEVMADNPTITPATVRANMHLCWGLEYLCRNPNFTIEELLELAPKLLYKKTSRVYKSEMETETLESETFGSIDRGVYTCRREGVGHGLSNSPLLEGWMLIAHPDLHWCWSMISMNRKITLDFIEAHRELPWVWDCVLENPNTTWEFIVAHPEIKWCPKMLSSAHFVTWDIIVAHPEIKWDLIEMSANRKIKWDYDKTSFNPNIIPEIVWGNPNIKWNYAVLKRHPNFPRDFSADPCATFALGPQSYYLRRAKTLLQVLAELPLCDDVRTNIFDFAM